MDDILILEEDILNNSYHIGLCNYYDDNLLFELSLPKNIFYENNHDQLLDHLLEYSTIKPNWKQIELMKIYFKEVDGFILYTCILKTHYLRIIQRRWKRLLKERKKLLNSGYFIQMLKQRELGILKLRSKIPGLK